MRKAILCALLAAAVLLPAPAGCTQAQDAVVDRHSVELASDLQTRRQLECAGIEREYELYRSAKLRAIDTAYDDALRFLEVAGKLNADSAKKAAERFSALRDVLNRMSDQAKSAALASTDWYDTAAKTVLATMEYRQTKDTAALKGLQAGLEAFGQVYFTTRGEPATEAEARADGLIGQFRNELLTMLQNRLGIVLPITPTP